MLHAGGQYRASEKAAAEAALLRHAGGLSVKADPAAQTATVRYDSSLVASTALTSSSSWAQLLVKCLFGSSIWL